MSDHTSQERYPVCEPWGPLEGLDPVQEYRLLADELQESFPDAPPQQLDCMIAQEMARYGGYSGPIIVQAMLEASLYLAHSLVGNTQDYVERTVDAAMRHHPTDSTTLAWGM
jgi:hypothetical protein